METWKTILSSLGVSAVVTAAFVFLLREWISARLRKSIEHEYKTKQIELRAELDGRLEGLKAGYQQVLDENQIRFSHLHAEQADAIKTLYQFLVRMDDKLRELTSPLQHVPQDEEAKKKFFARQREEAGEAFNNCMSNFQENRIFLSVGVCNQLDELMATGKSAFLDFTSYDGMEQQLDANSRRERSTVQFGAHKKMTGPFQEIREQLEHEFREALGMIEGRPGEEGNSEGNVQNT